MQAWGLHCTPDVWSEVDDAFARFCSALCPINLRDRFSTSPAIRAELSLPHESGGLGIPRVALEARLRAADQWDHRDAVEAGALPENVSAAYCRDDALDPSKWRPFGMEAYFKAAAEALAEGLAAADGRDLAWRQQRNRVRSALWAFNAVPSVDELTIDHLE